jgi:hypothetical protein
MAGRGIFKNLRWRHWGATPATATGTLFYKVYDPMPVTVAAWRPRTKLGQRSYTRLTVHYGPGNGWTFDVPSGVGVPTV